MKEKTQKKIFDLIMVWTELRGGSRIQLQVLWGCRKWHVDQVTRPPSTPALQLQQVMAEKKAVSSPFNILRKLCVSAWYGLARGTEFCPCVFRHRCRRHYPVSRGTAAGCPAILAVAGWPICMTYLTLPSCKELNMHVECFHSLVLYT